MGIKTGQSRAEPEQCRVRPQAAYHGVPLVGIPMYGDQPDNVAKAVHRGFGLLVPAHNLQVLRVWVGF